MIILLSNFPSPEQAPALPALIAKKERVVKIYMFSYKKRWHECIVFMNYI